MRQIRWIYFSTMSTVIIFAIVYSSSWDQRVIASQDDGLPVGYWLVTKIADTNDGVCNSDCSLREALSVAGSGETVIFDSATFSTARTITLGSQLLVSRGVKIVGPGTRFLTITASSGNHIFRLSSATSSVINIEVSGMTLANVNVQLQTDEGGAVQVLSFTSATFREVNFRNNIGWGGAAIYSTGNLSLIDCSVVNNAPIDHGAIWITGGTANIANTTIGGNIAVSAYGGMVVDAGTVTMNNVTIAHNQGSTRGGVSVAAAARFILRNTIIANNRTPAVVPSDVLGVFSSYSNNLIGVNQNSNFLPGLPNANDDYVGSTTAFLNPQLGALANNGGPTDTYALLSASPAINRGQNCVTTASCFTANPSAALTSDQRRDSFPRFVQSAVDIGAFEYGTMAVTNTDDTGAGSLRNAIANVPLGGAVGFSIPSFLCPLGVCTINLTSGELLINKSLRMTGTGARTLIVQRSSAVGTPAFRIFEITGSGTTVDLEDMTIRGGTGPLNGGGIQVGTGSTLKLTAVSIKENAGVSGGGILNSGNLIMLDSTVSNNTASSEGGGLRNFSTANIANSTIDGNLSSANGGGISNASSLTLNNVTISQNTGNVGGGIISIVGPPVNIRNTIVAANLLGSGDNRFDVAGAFTSAGNNLIGIGSGGPGFTNGVNGDIVGTNAAPIDPKLDSLGNDGGPTDTRSFQIGSPALHRGNNCVVNLSCSTANPPVPLILDQRGITAGPRQIGSYVDIGAYEAPNRPVITSITPQVWGAGGPGFEMTIHGISFTLAAQVRVGGLQRTVLFVSSTELRVLIPAADVQLARTTSIDVINPEIPSGNSGGVSFVVANCVITSQASELNIPRQGGSAAIGVTTTPGGGCPWTASTFSPWINVTTPSGPGTGQVSINIPENTGPARQGSITVTTGGSASVTVTVSQSAACTYITAEAINMGSGGGQFVTSVYADAGCAWTALTTSPWIQITSGPGQGSGQVDFTVSANTGANRSGTITVGTRSISINQSAGTLRRSPFDFDGDGKTDVGIFRPAAAGEWWINQSSTGITSALQFGAPSDRIVPADYTGDRKADIAFWRPGTGEWFVLRSEDFSFYAFPFGISTDIPAPADYDNDGRSDVAVYRPSNGTWYILPSTGGVIIEQFGLNGDVPVAADYDGDGRADLAIYRPSNGQWWIRRSTGGVTALSFGTSSDKPVQGDYTGDGRADVAFWRPSSGEWFVIRSEDLSYYAYPFGLSTDIPTPGDYDGDGKSDAGVFRPSSATWFLQRSSGGITILGFGLDGDRPLSNAYVP